MFVIFLLNCEVNKDAKYFFEIKNLISWRKLFFIEKNLFRPEALIVDKRGREAKINFGRAASRLRGFKAS